MAAKVGKRKFPAKLFVAIEEAGTNNEWLSAAPNADSHLTTEGERVIAEYELKGTRVGGLVPKYR